MSIQTYINKISRIEKEIATIQKSIATESKKESDNLSRINSIQRSITKSTPLSSIANKQRQIAGYSKNIVDARTKIASFQQKIAAKNQELGRAKIALQKEDERERKRVVAEEKRYRAQTKLDIEMNAGTTINAAVVHTGEGDINVNGGVLVGGQNNIVSVIQDYKSQLNDIVDQIEALSQEVDCDRTDIAEAIIEIRQELDKPDSKPSLLRTLFKGVKGCVIDIASTEAGQAIKQLVEKGIELISNQ